MYSKMRLMYFCPQMHGHLAFLLEDILCPKMANYLDLHTDVSFCTFNCRSIKSSTVEVKNLCESHDIVAIQEHWLLPFELDESSNIQVEFLSTGTSAVNVSQNGLVGRPYGVVLPSCRIKSLPVV